MAADGHPDGVVPERAANSLQDEYRRRILVDIFCSRRVVQNIRCGENHHAGTGSHSGALTLTCR